MRIVYATRATIPYPSAACLNTLQMCHTLVNLGHEVTLAVGRKFWRRSSSIEDWKAHFGFTRDFELRRFWELPGIGWGFDRHIAQYARRLGAMIYLRFPRLLTYLARRPVPTILELHSRVASAEAQQIERALSDGYLRGVVVLTHSLREYLLSQHAWSRFADRLHVAPDAVSIERFWQPLRDQPVTSIGYIGSLHPGKGMEIVHTIAPHLPDLKIAIYGGNCSQVSQWRARCEQLQHVTLHGTIPPAHVPQQLATLDIALLPNQPQVRLPNGDDIGHFTSPMKLFEYMAAGKPIIASDLPVIREVLRDGHNGLLVPHDQPDAWVAAIRRLQHDATLRTAIAAQAQHDAVSHYSYRSRFIQILDRFGAPPVRP